MQRRIAVVGAGGFAREVEWLLRDINAASAEGSFEFLGYVVSDPSRASEHDSPVLGDFSALEEFRIDNVVIGIGTPGHRVRIAQELRSRYPALAFPSLVHPSVRMDSNTCQVSEGVVLCAGTIATVGVRFDPFCMVNLSCTIGHEARIGSGSVLNPTVNISGGVQLGTGVLVGTGAQVLQYITVGDGATVGAGAVVSKHVAAGTTVVGVPAKPLERRS